MQDIDPYASRGSWTSNRNIPLTTDNKHRAINHGVFFEDLISLDDTYRLMLGGRLDFYKFKTRNIKGQTNSYNGNSFSPRVGFYGTLRPITPLTSRIRRALRPTAVEAISASAPKIRQSLI